MLFAIGFIATAVLIGITECVDFSDKLSYAICKAYGEYATSKKMTEALNDRKKYPMPEKEKCTRYKWMPGKSGSSWSKGDCSGANSNGSGAPSKGSGAPSNGSGASSNSSGASSNSSGASSNSSGASSNGSGEKGSNNVETKTLEQLYQDALAEGGRVIIYAGGDTPGQQDYFKGLFEKRFPKITMDVIVDYSKNHNARIDIQVANKSLIPDLVQFQTLQDFPRWKEQGLLLKYKPRSWDAIYPQFKDADGFFTSIYVIVFTNCISKILLPDQKNWPTEAQDYLRPDLAGKIALSYPNDDDAVLFLYKLIVDKHGWDYIQKLSQQNLGLVRGTQAPFDAVYQNKSVAAPATACGMATPEDFPVVFALPKQDPFMAWPQTAAIMKDAKRPATAKLYLNWITEKETQEKDWFQWSVRKDATPPKGYKTVFDYPSQMDPTAFGKWMADRGAVERFKQQIQQFLGEVKGEPSPGNLGVYPEKPLPH